MADIKQAAKWMAEGKKVRQGSLDEYGWFESNGGAVVYRNKNYPNFTPDQYGWLFVSDILADNWEIAE